MTKERQQILKLITTSYNPKPLVTRSHLYAALNFKNGDV